MMLADHAQVADGKLFISGAGWSACGPGPTPCAVAVIFHVPWQETDEKVSFSIRGSRDLSVTCGNPELRDVVAPLSNRLGARVHTRPTPLLRGGMWDFCGMPRTETP